MSLEKFPITIDFQLRFEVTENVKAFNAFKRFVAEHCHQDIVCKDLQTLSVEKGKLIRTCYHNTRIAKINKNKKL